MGAFYPTSYGINIGTVPKERRGLASAVINSGMSVGTALGLVFSGLYILKPVTGAFPFVVSCSTLLVPFLFRQYLPEPKNTANINSKSATQAMDLKI